MGELKKYLPGGPAKASSPVKKLSHFIRLNTC